MTFSSSSPKARARSMVVVIALFLLTVGAYGISTLLFSQTTSAYAVVYASDGSQTKLALDQDKVESVTTEKGTNVVEVSHGQVRMIEADCPNHDCIQQGAICKSNQQIVCLPHKLRIEIVGAQEEGSFDATTR